MLSNREKERFRMTKIYKDGLPPMSARDGLDGIEKFCIIMSGLYGQMGNQDAIHAIQGVYDAIRNIQKRVEKEEGKHEERMDGYSSKEGMRSHCKVLSEN